MADAPIAQVAKDFGICESCLRNWLHRADVEDGNRPGVTGAEVAAYIEAHAREVDDGGHRLVVRNGYHQAREVATAAGALPVRAPRVNDVRIDEVTGARIRLAAAILPAWCHKSPSVADVLPTEP